MAAAGDPHAGVGWVQEAARRGETYDVPLQEAHASIIPDEAFPQAWLLAFNTVLPEPTLKRSPYPCANPLIEPTQKHVSKMGEI